MSLYRFEVPLAKIAWRRHIGIEANGVGLVEVVVKGVEALGVDVAVELDAAAIPTTAVDVPAARGNSFFDEI